MPVQRIDADRLLVLLNIARAGSLTSAAALSGVSISALSQQLRRLEADAGLPLVDRHARGVTLTHAGEQMAKRAERIETELLAARADVQEIAQGRAGRLRIGTFPTAAASIVPELVVALRREAPTLQLDVHGGLRHELLRMLESRQVDASLLWEYPWDRLPGDAIRTRVILKETTELLVPVGHPVASRATVKLADLARQAWVLREDGHPLAMMLGQVFSDPTDQGTVTYRAHDYQEVQAMVGAGLGLSLAPSLGIPALLPGVARIRVTDVPPRRVIFAWMRGHTLSPAERLALELLSRADQSAPTNAEPLQLKP